MTHLIFTQNWFPRGSLV
uniref:Uncharacterized protein n=1 Tax=Arundo donax TaxID=35708 RepID=A0A0A9C5V7_ARUDO